MSLSLPYVFVWREDPRESSLLEPYAPEDDLLPNESELSEVRVVDEPLLAELYESSSPLRFDE